MTNFTKFELEEGLSLVTQVKTERAFDVRENVESQDVIKQKKAAMDATDGWMRIFYWLAKSYSKKISATVRVFR